MNLNPGNITIVDPSKSARRDAYIDELYRLRQRKGVTRQQAGAMIANRTLFAALMVSLSTRTPSHSATCSRATRSRI